MSKYATFRELVLATKEKFSSATELGKNYAGVCDYSHDYNGVGCAIGCHFDAEIANSWEGDVSSIITFAKRGDLAYQPILTLLGNDVDEDFLVMLQIWHDTADDVPDFISRLDMWLNGTPFRM